MYHRDSNLGLGNPEPARLTNNLGELRGAMWEGFMADFASNYKIIDNIGGFDYFFSKEWFLAGVEPTYQGDEGLVVGFNLLDKRQSYIENIKAWGPYGTQCVTKQKIYENYKINTKFIKFIDRWYDSIKHCFLIKKEGE